MSADPLNDVIDEAAALEQCVGDPDFLKELLGLFLEDEAKLTGQMEKALIENNHKEYAAGAHAIKGAALNLSLKKLAATSMEAEFTGRALEKASANPSATEVEFSIGAQSETRIEKVSVLLDKRQKLLEAVRKEYGRLKAWIAQQK